MSRTLSMLTVVLILAGCAGTQLMATYEFDAEDIATPNHLPQIGKWMIGTDGGPAHWLGEVYQGKALREPINVIIVDRGASSADDAKARLMTAATAAGYPAREGHSSGYQGWIGGSFFPQLPEQHNHAFSDEPFFLNNNHGRIFGAYAFDRAFVFIAAFSREHVDPVARPGHRYASFNKARDDFMSRMDQPTAFKGVGYVNLGNMVVDDPKISTGDHDGMAAMLVAN